MSSTMRRLLPKTFFAQLVLGTILVQSLFLGLFITYLVISQRRASDQRTRERVSGQLNQLATACARHMQRGDTPGVQEVLDLAEVAPTIGATRLTTLSGQTLAVSQRARQSGLDANQQHVLSEAAQHQVFTLHNGQPEAVTPVLQKGVPVALLWLEPQATISQNTAMTVTRIAMTYGVSALLITFLPIFLLVRSMTRPLRKLKEATERVIRNPQAAAGFPLPITSRNEAGALTASFNTMVRDLEEQRSGLLDTLALLDSMLSNAPIGLAFFDRDLRYVRVNDFLAQLHGLPAKQHIGLRASELYPSRLADQLEASIERVFQSGEALCDVELPVDLPQATGVSGTWLKSFYPVRPEHGAVRWVGVIVVDITDRLQAEETLRKTEKLAAAGRLAASVAHEINNPLEAVTNLLFILENQPSLDQESLGFVRIAQGELARVAEITQQTLRFYRQTASRGRTNLAEVLTAIVTLYQPRITTGGVTVASRFRGETDLVGFSGELRQLFANLIVNAVDAMPQGGRLLLRAHGSMGRCASGEQCKGVAVMVADTGTGMSPKVLAKIFEAFFTTKQATGTGLGLWVSEEIVRKHGGVLQVRSREGAGTCFRIFLPLDWANASEGTSRENVPALVSAAARPSAERTTPTAVRQEPPSQPNS